MPWKQSMVQCGRYYSHINGILSLHSNGKQYIPRWRKPAPDLQEESVEVGVLHDVEVVDELSLLVGGGVPATARPVYVPHSGHECTTELFLRKRSCVKTNKNTGRLM